MKKQKWFKWTVEFLVDSSWVADGFDLDSDRAREMLANNLGGALDGEIKATVICRPLRTDIRKAQGYVRNNPDHRAKQGREKYERNENHY